MEPIRYDAFISYRRENGFLMAQVIHDRLKDQGINCYLDLEEDRSGNFNDNLLEAIASAPNFILILPKNALKRCVNEDDWVRKEILEAQRLGKHIIPIMYDGFVWPRKWDPAMPQEIVQLQYQQGVAMSQEYLSAMISKLISYLKDVHPVVPVPAAPAPELPFSGEDFILRGIEGGNIRSIDMAFHSGSDWRRKNSKVELLGDLISRQIPLRILVNDAKTVDTICSHMRQPLKKYVGFDNSIQEWAEVQAEFPDLVQIRICQVPLLHRLYLVRREDGSGCVALRYYTYGTYHTARDSKACYGGDSVEFALYAGEFDYLWDKASVPLNL